MRILLAVLLAVFGARAVLADDLIDAFPFPLVTAGGSEAFATWQDLRAQDGTPIILGPREGVERILHVFDPDFDEYFDPIEVSLVNVRALQHPKSLFDYRKTEHEEFVASLRESGSDWADELAASDPLEIPEDYWGPWPDLGPQPDGLISLDDWQTGRPFKTVYIAILPTENPWEAPLHLRFGGWNANPMPEVHAAAFQHWAKAYGAVPVVMQSDIIEMYVENPPKTREAARELAREFYIYCNDIVDQGVGDMSVLAALLMTDVPWYFWWD